MENIKFPIIRLGNNSLQIKIDITIYVKEAVNAVCYKYTGVCYVHQEMLQDQDNVLMVTLESKENEIIPEIMAKQFCNDLIDQQLRYATEQKFGHIRDLIVEEAFKPISK